MSLSTRALILVTAIIVGAPAVAAADETDNFTCRARLRRDSLEALDRIMNARIAQVVKRANAKGAACDGACLVRALQREIGGSYRHPLTLVPHARIEKWMKESRDIERCRLAFGDSIYGARPYNQPWLFPFTGRIILLADSIRLANTVVGIDKVNHFIREGHAHWREMQRESATIDDVMRAELGKPGRQFRWNEYGLKGWSLTGVLAYADLAASYSGYRFWSALLEMDTPASYIVREPGTGRFVVRRPFTFADYVNDAWDEGINCSEFQSGLAKEVSAALKQRGLACPASDTNGLGALPDAPLYVNPRLLERPQ